MNASTAPFMPAAQGVLSVVNGGTGLSGITSGRLIYASGTNTLAELTLGTGLSITSGTLNASSGASPAGSGSELQYRVNGTTLGAVTGSSVSGSAITLTGSISAAGAAFTGGNNVILFSGSPLILFNGGNSAANTLTVNGSGVLQSTGGANFTGRVSAGKGYTATTGSAAYAATVTPNCDDYNRLDIGTLTNNITIASPTGTPVNGQTLEIKLVQDATGGRTVSFGTAYTIGVSPSSADISTAANAKLLLSFQYDSTDAKWWLVRVARIA